MPRPVLDLSGEKFGRLTAIEKSERVNGKTAWKVQCDCGNETVVETSHLRSGSTQSCGCLRAEQLGNRRRTHGGTIDHKKSPEFAAWHGVRIRRKEPYVPEWNDFQQFFKDVGWKPSDRHQLGRHDIREPHGPLNTYWRDPLEQQQRRNLTAADLGDKCFIDMRTFCLTT